MAGNSTTSRDVSPPPLKRKRLNASDGEIPASAQRGIAVYSWNVNGIEPLIQRPITSYFSSGSEVSDGIGDGSSTTLLRKALRRYNWPVVFCLQEVKINPDDAATISAVRQAVRRQNSEAADAPSYQAHFCLPSDKYNARGFGGKVYGVCTLIRHDFHSRFIDRVRPVSWDWEGRFLIAETKAVDGLPKLAIINVYAVNGTENPFKDPNTGEFRGTRHDRKLRVHALLQQECRELEASGFRVIVAGDINIARAAIDGFPNLRTFPKQHCLNRADFEARFISERAQHDGADGSAPCLRMIDSFRHLHPMRKGYTYYPRTKKFGDSCDRVDMILLNPQLKDSLREAGMHETPGDRGPSDHVPLYARLDFSGSLENATSG